MPLRHCAGRHDVELEISLLVNGAVKDPRACTREIGTCRFMVGHEQRITGEDGIPDLVGHGGRRIPGRVENLDLEGADMEVVTICERWSNSLPKARVS
jgi:hypothetical protein